MLDWKLLTGPIPWIVLALGVAGLLYLLYGRRRSWWTARVPIAVATGVVVAAAVKIVVDDVLELFPPQGIGPVTTVVVGLVTVAVMLALLRQVSWGRRWLALLAVVGVALAGFSAVNSYFAYYPDVRALVGAPPEGAVTLPSKTSPATTTPTSPNGSTRPGSSTSPGSTTPSVTTPAGPLVDSWNPPGNLPAKGTMSEVTIPATASGWTTQRQWVYLPPAAYADNAPDLPVLVLMPGDPGAPDQWALGLNVQGIMDSFAAGHKGLAPIVVMVDSRGTGSDPECLDSPRGKVFTFLTVDVPAFVKSSVVHADTDTTHWAVGGLSEGATCGLQLVVNAPQQFKTFVSFSGEAEILLSNKQEAIDKLFGGDAAAYAAVNPADILTTKKFPDVAGFVSVGAQDDQGPTTKMVDLMKGAGMSITFQQVDGGHDGVAFQGGLQGVHEVAGAAVENHRMTTVVEGRPR